MIRHISLALLLSLLSLQAQAASALIAVASNFLLPVKALAEAYEKESGHQFRVSSGSTGKLYAQIIHGAPYDLFLAANRREPERLEREGKIVAGSRFTYALGKLVLWSGDEALLSKNPEAVLSAGQFRRLANANPKTAPYGEAGQQVLNHIKPAADSRYRLIRAENVTQAFQYVATGNTEMGFIAYSQLLSTANPEKGSYWLVPQALYRPIEQQALLLPRGANNEAAKGFLAFLKTDKAKALIREHGYEIEAP